MVGKLKIFEKFNYMPTETTKCCKSATMNQGTIAANHTLVKLSTE